jgi:hypothetical protein
MATLQDCLKELPADMQMIDLPAPVSGVVRTVSELLERNQRIEEGFEVRDEKYDSGKKTRKVIGVIGGLTIYRQNIYESIDAMPPADFPAQVVILDKELGQRHPDKAFYLRVQVENGVDHVDLDGAVTPLDARRIARSKGYSPRHWMQVGDARPMLYC